jgi:ABC-type Mn2+/Zn2+ transport system permease subunit
MTVGPLVIFSLLVVPPMIALPWARGMTGLSIGSSLAGGLSAFAGFYLAYRYDLPLGPLIVLVLCAFLALGTGLRRLIPSRGR